ncbi:uncharacterized protein PV06_02350 [Exophiala oligosperma]|uniref:FAD-binding PCMH-type domain-containing protein n=1 Tax=Exophiala oligosperma TaxID=215243 RepID=A0A0D2CA23_9EURO|nr:uncharacterized protein PV06_02350 [Exophiala oligosperma]KIW46702.1 hypothetical protein PV06_02350 [Exophiala oligosperma]
MKQYFDPLQQEAHDAFFVIGRDGPPEVLPPNTSTETFCEVLDKLRQICQAENVITGDDLVSFIDPFAVTSSHVPSAAVCPSNVSEIQQILKLVNVHKIPVWVCSRGKNLGYGGPAPQINGSIVLSLHRMSSILEVNERGAYAVIEPGVTFRDLSEYCLENKRSVWPNVPSIGWGSVIGNALDRGIGYNALGDHWHNISGLEVVLANGDVVRTGQWAATDAPTAYLCKNSFGPSIDGLFLQSNLGIVTKMSLWLQPRPQTYMSVKVEVDKFADIAPLVDALGLLHREDILQSNPLIGDVIGHLSIFNTAAELYDGPGPIPEDKIEDLRVKNSLGAWTAIFDFYGTKSMVLARLERCREVLEQHCPSMRLTSRLFEGSDNNGGVLEARKIAEHGRGEPVGVVGTSRSSMINFALPRDGKGHGAHTDFVPLMPNDGAFFLKWFTEARKIMVSHGFNAILGGRVFKKHSFTIQMMFYDSSSATHRASLPAMWRDLAKAAEKYHLTNYRSHLDNMGNFCPLSCSPSSSFRQNNLDPNGVLSPGKQGIWPEVWNKYRKENKNDETTTNGTTTPSISSLKM